MPDVAESTVTREILINGLNEDLSREYQAIIAYVNYSQVLKGAAYMNIADELAVHAKEELGHALAVANHVDYLGGMPSVTPKPVKTSEKAEDMLQFDLDNERENDPAISPAREAGRPIGRIRDCGESPRDPSRGAGPSNCAGNGAGD